MSGWLLSCVVRYPLQEARKSALMCLDAYQSALYRRGHIVLMGSSSAPVPLNYMLVMFNNLEIIGNFMHTPNACLPSLARFRSGKLNSNVARPKIFILPDPIASDGVCGQGRRGTGRRDCVNGRAPHMKRRMRRVTCSRTHIEERNMTARFLDADSQ